MANVDTKHETVLDAGTTRARLARVYAESLLASVLAQSPQAADEIGTELTDLVRTASEHPNTREFLSNPTIGKRVKTAALTAALEGRSSDLVRGFVMVLAQNNRLDLLRGITAAYRTLMETRSGHVRVMITTAAPLGDDQKTELTARLKGLLKQEPVLDVRIDPDLLGGLVIQVGDTVIDTSVRTRLRSLRTLLLETGDSRGN